MLIWEKEAELEQAKLVYSKLDTLNMYVREYLKNFRVGFMLNVVCLELWLSLCVYVSCHGCLSYRGLLSSGALESQCRSSSIVSYNITII